jgi:hypothetical protein
MKNVINAVIKPRLFNGRNIGGLFHYANEALVSSGAGAIATWINICDVAAYGTKMKLLFKIANGGRERVGIFSAGPQYVKCQTLGALAANARKFF